MSLGLKKPEIDCKKSQDNRVFVYTWYHKSKAWLHNIALQIEKKNYESYLIMIMQ